MKYYRVTVDLTHTHYVTAEDEIAAQARGLQLLGLTDAIGITRIEVKQEGTLSDRTNGGK